MADITNGRWIERNPMSGQRSFQTARINHRPAPRPTPQAAIQPAYVFLGILLCTLIAPAAILIWAIVQASANLIH